MKSCSLSWDLEHEKHGQTLQTHALLLLLLLLLVCFRDDDKSLAIGTAVSVKTGSHGPCVLLLMLPLSRRQGALAGAPYLHSGGERKKKHPLASAGIRHRRNQVACPFICLSKLKNRCVERNASRETATARLLTKGGDELRKEWGSGAGEVVLVVMVVV